LEKILLGKQLFDYKMINYKVQHSNNHLHNRNHILMLDLVMVMGVVYSLKQLHLQQKMLILGM
jgi:hypothetical protein